MGASKGFLVLATLQNALARFGVANNRLESSDIWSTVNASRFLETALGELAIIDVNERQSAYYRQVR